MVYYEIPLEMQHVGNGEGKNRQLGPSALPRRLSALPGDWRPVILIAGQARVPPI